MLGFTLTRVDSTDKKVMKLPITQFHKLVTENYKDIINRLQTEGDVRITRVATLLYIDYIIHEKSLSHKHVKEGFMTPGEIVIKDTKWMVLCKLHSCRAL